MILKTKQFQEAVNKILMAVSVDKNASNLEIVAKENILALRVTNKEYYVAVTFELENSADFRAVVEANLFLNLISGINTDEFVLDIQDNKTSGNYLLVKAGKSSYKLALIYENDELMKLPMIKLEKDQINVQMPIELSILMSILNVNGREVAKAKKLDVNELQKYYFVDETGCFTFTSGACVNSFELEKPIKLLLNERIVKLFKLFDSDVWFMYGHIQEADGILRPVAVFQNNNTYIASRLLSDESLVSIVQTPCEAMKNLIKENYDYNLVLSASNLSAAIARLLMFYKNSSTNASLNVVPIKILIKADELIITDTLSNVEVISIENGSTVSGNYEMCIDLLDLKSVIDSCKNEHITFNCGNKRSVIITRGPISNVIAEQFMKAE